MLNTNAKYKIMLAKLLLALSLLLPACSEDSYGPSRSAEENPADKPATEASVLAEKSTEPVLAVGDAVIPMPAPDGFDRLPGDHPFVRAAQAASGPGEVVLCLFERADDSGLRPPAFITHEEFFRREIFQVDTLGKWLGATISAQEFLKIKQPWQDGAIEFSQSALSNFEVAANGILAGEDTFSYNLGKIDSSSSHISFLKVLKNTGENGDVLYTVATTSIVWRNGKILRVIYYKKIDDFGQIYAVVAESVGYVKKMETADLVDRAARLDQESR